MTLELPPATPLSNPGVPQRLPLVIMESPPETPFHNPEITPETPLSLPGITPTRKFLERPWSDPQSHPELTLGSPQRQLLVTLESSP